jgi:antitoxin component YwqK of YwqJK toxin-antitoxin module
MKQFKQWVFNILVLCLVLQNSFAQDNFNKLDDKGQKHGVWKGIFEESKRPRYEGTFNHGKETGTFKYFDDTKAQSLIGTREFNTKDNSAYTIFYDQKKNKVSEGKVIGKLHEGQWKYYHEASKEVMTLENYKNGKLNGLRSVFYPSGKIAEQINYSNDVKQGAYKKYSEKGAVLEEATYKDGVFEGPAIYRDPEGNIIAKGVYKHGKKTGKWQFYQGGKLVSEEKMDEAQHGKKSKLQ